MKTVQILSLEESFAFSFKHLGITSTCEIMLLNQETAMHPKMNAFIENLPVKNEGLNIIAEMQPTMVIDPTALYDQTAKVELIKQFISHKGINIIIERTDMGVYTFVSYTIKEVDFNSICY